MLAADRVVGEGQRGQAQKPERIESVQWMQKQTMTSSSGRRDLGAGMGCRGGGGGPVGE